MTDTLVLLAFLVALLLGIATGKAWERYKLKGWQWIDRRKARESPHYILGLNFLVSNQLDLAIEELTKAAGLNDDALEIDLILGNLYREKGQVSKSIQVHQSLLQRPRLTPLEHAHVLLCLGLDYKRGGFVDRAFEAFSEVARLDPENKYALLNLEKLHEEQHQWKEARVIRQRMTEAAGEPEKPSGQAILAFLENELGLQAVRDARADEAMRHFEAAIDMDTKTVPAYLNLGDVKFEQGQKKDAIETWERILQVSSEKTYLAFSRLESAYKEIGMPSRFLELCQRLVAANPQDWHQSIWRILTTLEFKTTVVERYVDLTRNSVFYLDPHICIRCRYRSTELLWQCPQCHEWNTFVEERITPADDGETESS